jgi:hypothetical protein
MMVRLRVVLEVLVFGVGGSAGRKGGYIYAVLEMALTDIGIFPLFLAIWRMTTTTANGPRNIVDNIVVELRT